MYGMLVIALVAALVVALVALLSLFAADAEYTLLTQANRCIVGESRSVRGVYMASNRARYVRRQFFEPR